MIKSSIVTAQYHVDQKYIYTLRAERGVAKWGGYRVLLHDKKMHS